MCGSGGEFGLLLLSGSRTLARVNRGIGEARI